MNFPISPNFINVLAHLRLWSASGKISGAANCYVVITPHSNITAVCINDFVYSLVFHASRGPISFARGCNISGLYIK